jgi:hypothetical protein
LNFAKKKKKNVLSILTAESIWYYIRTEDRHVGTQGFEMMWNWPNSRDYTVLLRLG